MPPESGELLDLFYSLILVKGDSIYCPSSIR